MTEQQAYEVLEEYPEFELRGDPDHLLAKTQVVGAFELARNVAFPRLARYIGGRNRSSRKIAMTAPVVQEQDPHSRRYLVGFVMPADVSAEDLQDPLDSKVYTRRVPAATAALRFSGRWSRSPSVCPFRRLGHQGSCGGTKSSSRSYPDLVGLQGSVEHDHVQPGQR